jgi:cell division protein FtsW
MCLAQKDIGSATIFGGILLLMCFIAGLPKRHLAYVCGFVAAGAVFVIATSTTARARFTSFLDLEGTKGYRGYQVYQSLLSIANGGPTGVGIGSGTGKWGYVPLSHSDFIFAIIAEELGLVGTVLVLGGFIALVYLGVQTALGARDMYGALLAGGVTAWFGVQAIVNIGGVTGSLPMTGLTLPFISYGGSSLMVSMAAAGLLLNVARNMK